MLVLSNLDLPSAWALSALRVAVPDADMALVLTTRVGQIPSESEAPLSTLAAIDRVGLCRYLNVSEQSQNDALLDALGSRLGCPVSLSPGINRAEGLALIASFDPDLMVSIRFGEILKLPAIRRARRGVLNLHSGRLPQLRGVMATFWAMLNGDALLGMTVHWVEDSGIDAGTIVSQTRQPLRRGASYLANTLSLYPAGVSALVDAIKALKAGQRLPVRLARGQARYYGYPSLKDFERFDAAGHQLVDPRDIESLPVVE